MLKQYITVFTLFLDLTVDKNRQENRTVKKFHGCENFEEFRVEPVGLRRAL